MADTSVSYKCPNCGAPLSFLPGHDHVTCEYCNTELDVATVDKTKVLLYSIIPAILSIPVFYYIVKYMMSD